MEARHALVCAHARHALVCAHVTAYKRLKFIGLMIYSLLAEAQKPLFIQLLKAKVEEIVTFRASWYANM